MVSLLDFMDNQGAFLWIPVVPSAGLYAATYLHMGSRETRKFALAGFTSAREARELTSKGHQKGVAPLGVYTKQGY